VADPAEIQIPRDADDATRNVQIARGLARWLVAQRPGASVFPIESLAIAVALPEPTLAWLRGQGRSNVEIAHALCLPPELVRFRSISLRQAIPQSSRELPVSA
jgi:hypothetical protein